MYAALPLVIVGAGLAGWTTAREVRKRAPDRAIVLISADAADFYAKPTLSNALAQKRTAAQLVTTPAAQMAQTAQVQLHAHCTVRRLDTATQTVHFDDAQGVAQQMRYGQLVLATGAHPIALPLAGDAAHSVRAVNHLQDLAAFHQALLDHPPEAGGPEYRLAREGDTYEF